MKPWRITIDTNPDLCNLNCIMCDTHSHYNTGFQYKRKSMERDLLEKCITDAIDIGVREIIPTTMGEPLLYEHFDTFIEKISQSKTMMNLTTNGTFPKDGVERWSAKILPVLSDVKISINGIDPKINGLIMKSDNTEKKIKDIKLFVAARDEFYPDASITLQVTFLKSNLHELKNIIKFAINNNINRVKGHHLWINYKEMEDESLQSSCDNIELWNNFVEKIEKYRDQIKLVNFDKLNDSVCDNEVKNDNNACPFLGEELWIDHNGNYNVCCAPSEKRATLGKWENIKDRSILQLFNSKEYNDLISNYKKKDVCKECPLRREI